jgi:hypothetical protein
MGYFLIGAEGLAAALTALALATAWAARGRRVRIVFTLLVFLAIAIPAAALVAETCQIKWDFGRVVGSYWLVFSASWLAMFVVLGLISMRRGLRRPAAELARPAATWPRQRLWFFLAVAIFGLMFTLWNFDLSVRADLTIARQECGAFLLAVSPPPVADAENAAFFYAETDKDKTRAFKYNAFEKVACLRASNMQSPPPYDVDWKDPTLAEQIKKNEKTLELLRKAAAMKYCTFGNADTDPTDAVPQLPKEYLSLPAGSLPAIQGMKFLAIDARVKAVRGDAAGAFEDLDAQIGIVRQIQGYYDFPYYYEPMVWRTLEDVLRLLPPGNEPLPPLRMKNLPSLVRFTRLKQALDAMILPRIASDPSLRRGDIRRKNYLVVTMAIDSVVIPLSRVLFIPEDLAAMKDRIGNYWDSPRTFEFETPLTWSDLRFSTKNATASVLGAYFIKPRQVKSLHDNLPNALLRQTAHAALAVEAYRRQHGDYPERMDQLVPKFLPSEPFDPRDGQPLRIKRLHNMVVIYGPADADAAENPPDFTELPNEMIFRLRVPEASANRGKDK